MRRRLSLIALASVFACDTAPRDPEDDFALEQPGQASVGTPIGHGLRTSNVPQTVLGSFGLGVEVDGDDLALAWGPVLGATSYDVWWSSEPYFEPGGEGALLLAEGLTQASFVHEGGDDDATVYYRVSADTGEISSTVGKFVQPLLGGYNKLGQPLVTQYGDALGLAQRLPPSVQRVFAWLEGTQRWDSYRMGGVDPFSIEVGGVVVARAAWGTNTAFHQVGVVPDPAEVEASLVVGQNLVTIPLHYGDTTASELFDALQVCERVGLWNAARQSTQWYTGADDEDFEIRAGMPVHLDLAHPAAWPPVDHVPPMNPLAEPIVLEQALGGFSFTEGVLWDREQQRLLFVDVRADQVLSWREGEEVRELRSESGAYANGMAFDAQGARLECEHANQRITRHDGESVEVVASSYGGYPFNSPNDVVVHPSGALFFTDPTFGSIPYLGGVDYQPLGFQGVFMVRDGEVTLVDGSGAEPNGIGLSPDGRTLYVSDYASGQLRAIPLSADLVAGEPVVLSDDVRRADGMCLDAAGNVYVTSHRSLRVFAPDGTPWGEIDVPRHPSNCTFGGEDGRTLYVSARQRIYRARVTIPGIGFTG